MASRIASNSLRSRATAAVVLVAALIALIPASSAAIQPPFLACLVTGSGGANDAAFNALAATGLQAAQGNGVLGRSEHGSTQADYVRELRACAIDGAGITIAVGYGMATALDQVATAYPRSPFAIVDGDVRTLAHRPANVAGLVFREQQAGYLAGYTAGLWATARHGAAVGAVGALDIPPVERALAGFRFGAKRAHPGLRVLTSYSGNFDVAAQCEQKALAQIAHGSVVEFQVAGSCGAGVLAAARAKRMTGIGFGAETASAGASVLTTALERADVAVETVVHEAHTGQLMLGKNGFFSVANGGIGVGKWSPRVPPALRSAVETQVALLRAGRVAGIPTTLP